MIRFGVIKSKTQYEHTFLYAYTFPSATHGSLRLRFMQNTVTYYMQVP